MKRTLITAFLLLLPIIAQAQTEPTSAPPQKADDLTELKLEDLLKVQVTTASRREQNLSEVPAAISVLTQEDIRRSGLTTVPELLRLLPGMQVAQITGNRWAVSARGFNNRFAPYLQVLVDGRSVYTLDFGGVYWDSIDLVLEDIERIEVLRGPQATLWGVNAVNGVINIITKHTRDTQGQLATVSGGSLERASGVYRQGGKLSDTTSYRVYGKYRSNGPLQDAAGNGLPDYWETRRLGVRFDGGTIDRSSGSWMATAEVYSNPMGNRILVPRAFPTRNEPVDSRGTQTGYHALARWDRQQKNGAGTRLQVFVESYHREEPEAEIRRDKYDFDLQHQLAPLGQHSVLSGIGYRYNNDRLNSGFVASFTDPSEADKLYSAFVQDTYSPSANVRVIVGTRYSNDKETGDQWQPNARISWTPTLNRTVWAAVARAVRLPSRGALDVALDTTAVPGPGGSTIIAQLQGNPDLGSESVMAYELGVRFSDAERYSADISGFYNVYKALSASRQGNPQFASPTLPIILPLTVINGQHGEAYGMEFSSRLSLTDRWRINLGYAYLKQDIKNDPGEGASTVVPPFYAQNQVQVTSHVSLSPRWETDAMLFYVDSLPDGLTSAYVRFDARLGWRANARTEASLTVQNLFSGARYEFRSPVNEVPGRVPTGVIAKVVVRI